MVIFFLDDATLKSWKEQVRLQVLGFWSLGKKRRLLDSFLKEGIWSDSVKCYTRGDSSRLVCQVAATIVLLTCCCDSVLSLGKPNCGFGVLLEICTV